MSNKQSPKDTNPDFRKIANAADEVGSSARAKSDDERLNEIEDRLASIEPLLEQLQVNAQLGTKLTDYVDDLRQEQVFFNRARWAVGILALLVLCGLIVLLGLALFHSKSPLLRANPIAIATFVIGLISGIALMMSSFVKGVFRSTAERHADGYLPPALEKSVELLNKVTGKS